MAATNIYDRLSAAQCDTASFWYAQGLLAGLYADDDMLADLLADAEAVPSDRLSDALSSLREVAEEIAELKNRLARADAD